MAQFVKPPNRIDPRKIVFPKPLGAPEGSPARNPNEGEEVGSPPTFTPAHAHKSMEAKSPFIRFSLRGSADDLDAGAADTKPILGVFIMDGQATMIYAAPNTGKTLIMVYLVIEAIKEGRIDPNKVFYFNADDGSRGLAMKVRFLQEVGAHMLAPGHRGFKIRHLVEKMVQAVEDGTALGTLIVIDTLKKFTDLMDKKRSSEFAQVCREYVMAGGTVVALGHTAKNSNADGSPRYQGTTDILEDFDAVYVAEVLTADARSGEKVVRFRMQKKRSDSPDVAAYAYANGPGVAYEEMLASVQYVDPDEVDGYDAADAYVDEVKATIEIARIIGDGFDGGKLALASAAAEACKISKRKALKMIEAKTGTTVGKHMWTCRTISHGKLLYTLTIHG